MPKKIFQSPFLLATLTIFFGVLPFLVYFMERRLGYLPSSEIWYSGGINHGPWRSGLESVIIFYPLLMLVVATVGMFLFRGLKNKSFGLLFVGLALILIQISFLFLQMYYLTWTID